MDDMLGDALDQLLADVSAPAQVRAIEAGGGTTALWRALEESGFADTLVPEAQGGAGLGLRDAFTLFEACGRHVLPLPLAETMLARALLAQGGASTPSGSVAIASSAKPPGSGEIVVNLGAVADWLLLSDGDTLQLFDLKHCEIERATDRSLEARVSRLGRPDVRVDSRVDLRAQHALILSAQMAGTFRRVLATSLQYANERVQFGRSIGKFQAIQHQLAQMAEHVEAARTAARLGCSTSDVTADPLMCAMAKAATSAAVVPVTGFAHAVHGAIGVTREYDLQLLTRRLHLARVTAGTESHWNERVGRALLSSSQDSLPEFVRTKLGFGTCTETA